MQVCILSYSCTGRIQQCWCRSEHSLHCLKHTHCCLREYQIRLFIADSFLQLCAQAYHCKWLHHWPVCSQSYSCTWRSRQYWCRPESTHHCWSSTHSHHLQHTVKEGVPLAQMISSSDFTSCLTSRAREPHTTGTASIVVALLQKITQSQQTLYSHMHSWD